MDFCTIISLSRLPYARALFESLAVHHPGSKMHVLMLDDLAEEIDPSPEPFRIIRPSELSFLPGQFEHLAILCDQKELEEALIPRLLVDLLTAGVEAVAFIAATQRAFAPLTSATEAIGKHDVVVAPRLRSPLPLDERSPSDADALERGVFTTSFVGVASGAKEFLSWWWERVVEQAFGRPPTYRWLGALEERVVRQALGRLSATHWLDLAERYFGAHVLYDPGVCVSFWNIAGRPVTSTPDGWMVDDRPLRSFDFEGFDPDKPHLLSTDQGNAPRVLLSDHPELAALCREYAASLDTQGAADWTKKPYGFGVLPNGMRVDRRMRRLYREAMRSDVVSHELPPNPFVRGGSEAFLAWLKEPIFGDVSRYVYCLYTERWDLQAVYRDPTDPALLEWARLHGVREKEIPAELLPEEKPVQESTEDRSLPRDTGLLRGVNVIGFLTAQVGLGNSGRALLDALDQAGVPHSAVSLPHPLAPDNERRRGKDFEAPYDLNVVCGTPDLPLAVAKDSGNEIFRNRYNVGLFFWEAQEFRGHISWGMRFIDEVWASSRYIADAVKPVFDGPVSIFPHPISVPQTSESLSRSDLGLPEGFLFLFVFDYTSSFPRKNPLGLVDAFKRAFRPEEGPVLGIKTIYGDRRLLERERLWFAAADRPDIILLEGMWPHDRKNALIAACDCYVSLHRSEGLGLTMAEAMILGKPVIATGYSGNRDFMTKENSYLVRHGMTKVGRDVEPYDPEWEWADPDIDHAAELMRHVYENRDEATAVGARAREHILRDHSVERAADFVKERLEEIRRAPRAGAEEVLQEATIVEATEEEPEMKMEAELESERRARDLIERGPDLLQPTRFGVFGRLVRRIVLFLLRPYDRHQREVQRAILHAQRQSRERR